MRSVTLEPAFGPAWALLSNAHAMRAVSHGLTAPAFDVHSGPARDALAKAMALSPDDVDTLIAATWVAAMDADLERWLSTARRAVELHPQHAEAIHRLAHGLEESDGWESALQAYRARAAATPLDPFAWLDLGRALLAVENFDDARVAFQRLAPIDEAVSDMMLAATELCATGNPFPSDRLARLQSADGLGDPFAAMATGDLERARLAADRDFKADLAAPTQEFRMSRYALAESLFLVGRSREAEEVFAPIFWESSKKGLKSYPRRRLPLLHLLRQEYHRFGGRIAEAKRELELALQLIDPADHSNLASHSRRLAAQKFAQLGDAPRAVAILTDALVDPTNDGVNGCAWAIWRDRALDPVRDHEPLRALMRRHGVEPDRGLESYARGG
jgi:tetratricopeptide (TPR) repeat protein